ncbi:MAG: PD-(D/E)XK nuclease family protein, partial [Bacteroidetes bacterium]|nr:PD-(D/E)XK nuclease family protein [Bacteroidota bacterium]
IIGFFSYERVHYSNKAKDDFSLSGYLEHPQRYGGNKGEVFGKILNISQNHFYFNLGDKTIKVYGPGIKKPVYGETVVFLNFRKDGIIEMMDYHNYNYNYFLYGIIDKLIITESKIIIVDYKTDDIDKANIEERAKYYSNQLKFYIYIVSRLYTKINEFEIRIVFLIHPDNPYSVSFNRTEIIGIEQDITLIIEGILKEEYPKNLSHCNDCGFSINGSCVVKN